MRIVKLSAENFKRLKAVEIVPDPDGNLVILSGKNMAGKTSVLDALWQTLAGGTAAKTTSRPIRDGADHAEVTVDLGEYRVTRSWTAKGTYLKVESADGAQYKSPQALLDGLVGKLSFDPLQFAQAPAKTQRAMLLDLVELPFDLDELEMKRATVFDQRTELNRAAKKARAYAESLPDGVEGEPRSADEIFETVKVYRAQEAVVARAEATLSHIASRSVTLHARVEELREELADRLAELDELTNEEQAATEAFEKAEEQLEALPRVEDSRAALAEIDAHNEAVRAAEAKAHAIAEAKTIELKAAGLTAKLEEFDAQKQKAIAAAEMPIEGLGFDDTGVTFQGVPFSQASAAEQLRVSVAMAMAANPTIRVIRITDASLLDSTSLKLIEETAKTHDYQIWLEIVDETGNVGFYLEDGSVV